MSTTRRQVVTGALSMLFTATAVDALLPWSGTIASAADAGNVNVGATDAEMVMTTARGLLQMDNRFGGGAVFATGVAFARDVANPMLAGSYTETTGKALFAATSYLHHVLGWAAYDTGDFHTAAEYLTTALRQAKVSGDQVVLAGILTDMAHLSRYIGDPKAAVRLTRAADAPGLPGAIAARNAAIEARAWAAMGDRGQMDAAIGRALDALDAARPGSEPEHALSGWFDHDQLASELAYAEVDGGRPAGALQRTERITDSPALPRRNAAVQAARARAHLNGGDLEAGLAAADAALRTTAPAQSVKGTWHLRAIGPALKPYLANPAAGAMVRRISEALAAA